MMNFQKIMNNSKQCWKFCRTWNWVLKYTLIWIWIIIIFIIILIFHINMSYKIACSESLKKYIHIFLNLLWCHSSYLSDIINQYKKIIIYKRQIWNFFHWGCSFYNLSAIRDENIIKWHIFHCCLIDYILVVEKIGRKY